MFRARRPKLGQHFLADSRYRRTILDALQLRDDDLVIEIGAGRGALTELLVERARRVVAVEIDARLAERLKEKLAHEARLEVLHADILSIDISEVCRCHGSAQCFVFGNLPYYITSPIVHHLFGSWASIRAMALLVQREVAERLTASPGRRTYGYLSVLARVYSQPRVALSVPAGAFSPPPKVQSALVRFDRVAAAPGSTAGGQGTVSFPPREEEEPFLNFVKRCFVQKRKNLPNNLAVVYSRSRVEQELGRLGLASGSRAEQLTVAQFAELFRRLQS
jgi:16S rRNA (adenine1518-N6/adenine1519-N6)-dimethyltransferase